MSPKEAPWLETFKSHLKILADAGEHPYASLATVTSDGFPRVRSIGHQRFWSITKDGSTLTTPCPTFTTDSRNHKISHIFGERERDQLSGDFERYGHGSGGGGPVEAVYWLSSVKMQWRIRGRCYIVTDGKEASGNESSSDSDERRRLRREGLALVRAAVGLYMVPANGENWANVIESSTYEDEDSAWEAEVQSYYDRLSTPIQISFLRSAFGVGIIVPEEAEMMDLTDAAVARRRIWRCTLDDEHGTIKWDVVWDNI